MKRKIIASIAALAVSGILAACGSGTSPSVPSAIPAAGSGAGQTPGQEFPRAETLYTGGKQWGPVNNWNPFMTGNYATGTLGLVYETLFIYDPLTDQYTPWLAESGK